MWVQFTCVRFSHYKRKARNYKGNGLSQDTTVKNSLLCILTLNTVKIDSAQNKKKEDENVKTTSVQKLTFSSPCLSLFCQWASIGLTDWGNEEIDHR